MYYRERMDWKLTRDSLTKLKRVELLVRWVDIMILAGGSHDFRADLHVD